MNKPIKRHQSLQAVSREHHHGLLLSWKIKEGLKLQIEPDRIKKYTDWYWENHLQQHFEFEEKYIFPILKEDNPSIKRALREHKRLKRLFSSSDRIKLNLSLIEEELVAHIRFEERVLFKEVEVVATEKQFKAIEKEHLKIIIEEWQDEFWVSKAE